MRRNGFFHGYGILLACFVCAMIGVGCTLGSFSLFIADLDGAMGWTRTQIMTAFSLMMASIAVTSPFMGRLLDVLAARHIIAGGGALIALSMAMLSRMDTLPLYYTAYVLMGIGSTATGPVVLSYVVSHWFVKNRGTAIGILSMGMSAGSFLIAPVIAVWLIPSLGWRNAYLAVGALSFISVVPLALLVIKDDPSAMGLFPDGHAPDPSPLHPKAANTHQTPPTTAISLVAASATGAFWAIAVSLVLNHTHLGILQSVFPHLGAIGFSPELAVSAVSITSMASLAGMFFFGWLSDRLHPRWTSVMGLLAIAMAILILSGITLDTPQIILWAYAILMGIGIGSWLPTMSMLTIATFGMASYGTVFGAMSLFQNLGGSLGPLLTGIVYDARGSYPPAFILIFAMVVLAIPLVLLARPPKRIGLEQSTGHSVPAA